MKPGGGGDATGDVAKLIEKQFGSFANFKVFIIHYLLM
jgi:superoxide dismutase